MDRGIYTSASGGLLNQARLDITGNNLANASTVGFKAQRLISRQQEFEDTLASNLPDQTRARSDMDRSPGAIQAATVTDFSPGPISYTSDPLNVALTKPNQFFVVTTDEGETYTRAGNFMRTAEGQLVTVDGFPVQGDGGPITLPQGDARIASTGSIIVGRQTVGRLRVVEIGDPSRLQRLDGVRFQAQGIPATAVDNPTLVPQSVELANTGTIESMVDMITAQKAFEAYTKTIRSIDELNERAIRTARTTG